MVKLLESSTGPGSSLSDTQFTSNKSIMWGLEKMSWKKQQCGDYFFFSAINHFSKFKDERERERSGVVPNVAWLPIHIWICCIHYKNIHLPKAFDLSGTVISLLNSRDAHCIDSAFARRISILVDKTSYLHLEVTICLQTTKHKRYTWNLY